MVELVKLFLSKPLEAIIVVICLVLVTIQMAVFELQTAQAVLVKQEEYDMTINEKVLDMTVLLARIDENVKSLKKFQEGHHEAVELSNDHNH